MIIEDGDNALKINENEYNALSAFLLSVEEDGVICKSSYSSLVANVPGMEDMHNIKMFTEHPSGVGVGEIKTSIKRVLNDNHDAKPKVISLGMALDATMNANRRVKAITEALLRLSVKELEDGKFRKLLDNPTKVKVYASDSDRLVSMLDVNFRDLLLYDYPIVSKVFDIPVEELSSIPTGKSDKVSLGLSLLMEGQSEYIYRPDRIIAQDLTLRNLFKMVTNLKNTLESLKYFIDDTKYDLKETKANHYKDQASINVTYKRHDMLCKILKDETIFHAITLLNRIENNY